MKIVVVADLFRRLEIETQPGEPVPSIVMAGLSGDVRVRLDVVMEDRLGEFETVLDPAADLGSPTAGDASVAPAAESTVPAAAEPAPAGDIGVQDFEQCEPGNQQVS